MKLLRYKTRPKLGLLVPNNRHSPAASPSAVGGQAGPTQNENSFCWTWSFFKFGKQRLNEEFSKDDEQRGSGLCRTWPTNELLVLDTFRSILEGGEGPVRRRRRLDHHWTTVNWTGSSHKIWAIWLNYGPVIHTLDRLPNSFSRSIALHLHYSTSTFV